jgi:RsiW-degrading membrane proteinase PrsW (M82 family)
MERLAVLAAAIAPALVLLGYGVAKGRGSWQNHALWTAFLAGAAVAIAPLAGQAWLEDTLQLSRLPPLFDAAGTALLVAAIPEETAKFLVVVAIAGRWRDARRLQDLIVLALGAALGFAFVENLAFVTSPGDWQTVALMRASIAVPGHGIDGLTMGALLTMARLNPERRRLFWVAALLLPIALHASYDFPLLLLEGGAAASWVGVAWLIIIGFSAVVAISLTNRVLAVTLSRRFAAERRAEMSAAALILGGAALFLAGPLLGASLYLLSRGRLPFSGAAPIILPAALGGDLLRSGLQRRRGLLALP